MPVIELGDDLHYYKMSNEDGTVSIVERNTGHRIYSNLTAEGATTILARLNIGRGFDGWTPSFCIPKTLTKINRQKVA